MAHTLSTRAAPATTAIPISTRSKQSTHSQTMSFHRVSAFHQGSDEASDPNLVNRRSLAFGLGGIVLGLNTGEKIAGAARRPPPPPAQEKKDPSVSGLMAKILASKKRKEAMKEEITKLREKGKAVPEPSE
ncbi:hypothetical protein ACH5RR_032264 [Cinchona calisaya]|uniref:Uncharacterized protein n=1 Tax=Cinchona calisaya TaxID=153742 RepID=A0ABD2YLZ5_9GENT